jgi:SAM-dependent methyltransferase
MSFAVVPSPEIWYRDDFAILANWRKLWRAAEIGVDRAEWAGIFLQRWIGHEYWGIDPYRPYRDMPWNRESDYLFAVDKLKRFSHRGKLIRDESLTVAATFERHSLDFIYIDGAHDYTSVRDDIRAWWPVLQPNGILAGHDWTEQAVHAGVKEAVGEFAEEIDQTVYITTVPGYREEVCPSWYLYKSGMPGPDWRRC